MKRWVSIIVGLVAIFAVIFALNYSLKLKRNPDKYVYSNTPTLFIHGYGGTLNSTKDLVRAAEKSGAAKKMLTARVTDDGHVKLSGHWDKNRFNPMVQIVFSDNRNTDYQTDAKWIKNVVVALQHKYGIKSFNAVAHSMGNLGLMTYEMTYGQDKSLPKLRKQVSIAGHFDGIVGIDKQVADNHLDGLGKPEKTVSYYDWLLARQDNYPKNQVDVLNIYGDLDDGTHSDGRVSTTSAKSLQYLLGDRPKSYQERLISGPEAQHSKLHENNQQVNHAMIDFLWGRTK